MSLITFLILSSAWRRLVGDTAALKHRRGMFPQMREVSRSRLRVMSVLCRNNDVHNNKFFSRSMAPSHTPHPHPQLFV
ncbi:hypothetical protein F5887DRAFT_976580 [Amanita rubescens]|nr:hypothetical protein F5887DRAFT_976580 [Amanita rubescens]